MCVDYVLTRAVRWLVVCQQYYTKTTSWVPTNLYEGCSLKSE